MDTLFQLSPIHLILRTAIVYAAVLCFLRIAGKKQLGQMGPTDFVALLLISESASGAMTGGDDSVLGGLLSALVLIGLARLIDYTTFKNERLRRVVAGVPTVIIQDGTIVQANLDKELMTPGELMNLLRQQGVERVADVHIAVLTPEGMLSVARHQSDLEPPAN